MSEHDYIWGDHDRTCLKCRVTYKGKDTLRVCAVCLQDIQKLLTVKTKKEDMTRINHSTELHIGDTQKPVTEIKDPNMPDIAQQMRECLGAVGIKNGVSQSQVDGAVECAKAVEIPGMEIMVLGVTLKNGMRVVGYSWPDDGEPYLMEKEFEKAKERAMEQIRVLLEYHNKELSQNYPQLNLGEADEQKKI